MIGIGVVVIDTPKVTTPRIPQQRHENMARDSFPWTSRVVVVDERRGHQDAGLDRGRTTRRGTKYSLIAENALAKRPTKALSTATGAKRGRINPAHRRDFMCKDELHCVAVSASPD